MFHMIFVKYLEIMRCFTIFQNSQILIYRDSLAEEFKLKYYFGDEIWMAEFICWNMYDEWRIYLQISKPLWFDLICQIIFVV